MNNRQNGRRRGRNNNNNNNNRPQSGGGRGGTDQANRIDSRARGNAAQMIEKFKNLARDAQLSGDRVQTEYYLQFADHYFRVHSDFRARQEEKNGGQPDRNDRHREVRGVEDFDAHDDTDLDEGQGDSDGEREDNRGERDNRERGDRNDRNDRGERNDRGDRGDRNPNRGNRRDENDDNRGNRQPVRERAERSERPERPERERVEVEARDEDAVVAEAKPARAPRRSPRRPRDEDEGGAGIDSAVLPPAIGRPAPAPAPEADEAEAEAAEAAPKPRKRRTLAARSSDVEAAE
ncbi:DUF4167 domain-containing protein [Sphingopyxis sp. OPL5]|nr:DUF4167 domain-containing protein [Sphingopyxis sp. OPL5]